MASFFRFVQTQMFAANAGANSSGTPYNEPKVRYATSITQNYFTNMKHIAKA
jgi:hypothetical protein